MEEFYDTSALAHFAPRHSDAAARESFVQRTWQLLACGCADGPTVRRATARAEVRTGDRQRPHALASAYAVVESSWLVSCRRRGWRRCVGRRLRIFRSRK